LSNFILKV